MIMLIFAISNTVFFIAGISIGYFTHKRKRDKEMAGFVAERLLRKPQVIGANEPTSGVQANANAMQGQMTGTNGGLFGITTTSAGSITILNAGTGYNSPAKL